MRAVAGANARIRAASRYAEWRAEGVPSAVTSHEAWRLSEGRVGIEGNHTDRLNLSRVAQIVEGAR